MAKGRKALDSNVVAQLKAQLQQLLPTFEQFLNEEAAEPAHQGGQGGAEGAAAGAENAAAGAQNAQAAAPANGGETGSGEVAAAAAPGATEEGEGEADAGNGDQLTALVQQLAAILPQLQQLLGGAEGGEAEGGAQAAGGEGGAEGSGEGEAGEGSNDQGEGAGGMGGAEGGEGSGEGETTDAVEGLEGTAREGTDEGGEASLGEGGNGTASAGPAAGKHTGADAALRAFHADLAYKGRIVDRLSKVVGAFDGALDVASATADDVVAYGLKKLKIKCDKGTERIALDAFLTGAEAARKHTGSINQQRAADAAAAQEVPAIDAYFKAQE